MKPKFLSAVILLLGVVSFSVKAQDQPPGQKPKPLEPSSLQQPEPAASARVRSPAEKYFSDVELINQDGQKMRFYSDVLKDKVVVINTFFTTCTGVCPPINRTLERMQEALGDRLGKDAFLVSMSVDPETDTPSRLKEYSRDFMPARVGFFSRVKKRTSIGLSTNSGSMLKPKTVHTTIIIIGNEPKGLWKKAFGLAKADELIRLSKM
jgi:protein SCO1/2